MNEPWIHVRDLTVRYGSKTVLEKVTLDVMPGEMVSIVGPNGGGKTTLLKVILGMKDFSEGEVRVLGEKPGHVKAGEVGYLPQINRHLRDFPIRARDVVLMGRFPRLGLLKRPGPADRKLAEECLEIVGMSDSADVPVQSLSGGQVQRVFIARALAMEPKLLILDEPSTGLDAVSQEDFYGTLRRLRDNRGISILMVSHDIGVVSNYVDKIACLNRHIHYHGPAGNEIPEKIIQEVFGRNIQILVHNKNCVTCREGHSNG
ncbi:MAG: metal ABC transporter ATP-binding protein [Acidobacteria bacterium]|nr:metal ABC transporter ATP-binding protein [Acidobacteriota bacterium]